MSFKQEKMSNKQTEKDISDKTRAHAENLVLKR